MTSLIFVASSFSSTSIEISVSNLTLLASPLPLPQCTRLERGEPSKDNFSVIKDDSLARSNELTLVEPYVVEAPFEDLCGDDIMFSV